MYYKIENDYPIISPILLDGFTEYTVGSEPLELQTALQKLEKKEKFLKLKMKFKEKTYPTKLEMFLIHLGIAYLIYKSIG